MPPKLPPIPPQDDTPVPEPTERSAPPAATFEADAARDYPGAPTLAQIAAGRSGQTTFGQRYRQVAGWTVDQLGNVIGKAINPILDTAALPAAGPPGGSNAAIGTGPAMAQDAAGAMVGSTMGRSPTDLGRNAGIAGAGLMTGGMGPLAAGATIAGGGIAGGAIGGGLDQGDLTGALQGGKESILPSLLAGGLTGAWESMRRIGQNRVLNSMSQIDAPNFSKVVKQIPKLNGVFANMPDTPAGVRSFALDPVPGGEMSQGQALLSARMQQVDQVIKDAIGKTKPDALYPDPLSLGKTAAPSKDMAALLDKYGPEVVSRARQGGLDIGESQPGRLVRWDEARQNLSELGTRIKSASGAERGDLSQQYAEALRGLRKSLSTYDPSGQAVKAFNQGQETYEAGQAILSTIKKVFAGRGQSQSVIFDGNKLMDLINQKSTGPTGLAGRLGPDGLALLKQFRPGFEPGTSDVYSTGGNLGRLMEYLPLGGAGAYLRGNLGMPKLAGQNPLGLGVGARTGLAIGAGQAGQLGQGLTAPQGLAIPPEARALLQRNQANGPTR